MLPEQIGVFSVRVSSDQRFVMGLFFTGQVRTVRWWRLADPGAMVTAPGVPQDVQPTWRPLTNQIAWVEDGILQLLDVERGVTNSAGTLPPGNVSREAARLALFEWLETWYNRRRRHSSLRMLAPLEFERRWQLQAALT